MLKQVRFSLADEKKVRVKYACEKVSPDTYYDYMHSHPFFEICVFLSGSMLHFADEHSYHLSRGDVFFCRPGELHYALAAKESVYERYAFWIPADLFAELPHGADEALGIFSDSRLHDLNIIHLDPSREEEMLGILEKLKAELFRSPYNSLALFCRISEFLLFMNSAALLPAENGMPNIADERSPILIHNVIRYVCDNFSTIKCIDEIADANYINKDYMTRIFKKHTGFTVYSYLHSVRISNSRRMLADGKSVTETAYDCGFNSTSYFIKMFTRATGITPAVYARSNVPTVISEK